MIQLDRVSRRFHGGRGVHGLSFSAGDASITGLLGANGAGKTTTLRMIAGVLRHQTGEIRVGGPNEARRNALGAVLDHTGLYSRLSARENLAYFGQLRGIPAAELQRRISIMLERLGLAGLADRPVARFSQGEQLKVALGRVLLHEPGNLLLDEPTNGLDVPSVRALRALLVQLRDAGACILFSSHVLGEIEALCDRVVVIANGRVMAKGTLDEVRSQARSETLEGAFVALTSGEKAP